MSLLAESITAGYRAAVLHDVSCAIEPGTVTAIIGPNGAGKTTLLRVLLGSLKPMKGAVRLDGADAASLSPAARARRVAFIPQATAPDSPYSALEVVRLGRVRIAEQPASAVAAARAALELVGLSSRADAPLGSLSAGQLQRILLARALAQLDVTTPRSQTPPEAETVAPPHRYLLADEPVASMDPRYALDAMELLVDAAHRGIGVGVVLHDFALAAAFCSRCIVLNESGRIAVAADTADALNPARLANVFGVEFDTFNPTTGRSDEPNAAGAGAAAVPIARRHFRAPASRPPRSPDTLR